MSPEKQKLKDLLIELPMNQVQYNISVKGLDNMTDAEANSLLEGLVRAIATLNGELARLQLKSKQWIQVKSDVLKEIRYFEDSEKLQVLFRNGTAYEYELVPSGLMLSFLMAESKGRFFNSYVKGHFSSTRIPGTYAL